MALWLSTSIWAIAESDRVKTGITYAKHDIDMSLPVDGVVEKIHVKIGDRVAAGEPLFTLKNLEAEAEKKQIIKELDNFND